MTLLATIIVLGVLIFVHELGHFLAAKAVNVEVQRFSIGLGPRLWSFQKGETEYALSAIPLGGYVKMGGMDDEVTERIEGGSSEAREPSPRDFDGKPVWARVFVISAGVIMNMAFAFLVYAGSAAFWGIAQPDTDRVGAVAVERLPEGTEALAGVEPGSRVVRVGDREVEHWGDVRDAFLEGPAGPAPVVLTEPDRTLEIRIPADDEARLRLASAVTYWVEPAVGAVDPGSPADRGGLEVGDRILAVNAVPVTTWQRFVEEIAARPGARVELRIERDGAELTRVVELESQEQVDPATGEEITTGRIGVYRPVGAITYRSVGLASAIVIGWQETVVTTEMILGFLKDLVTGGVSPRSVGSIVTIGEASGQAAALGMAAFLRFMALFSINLAVLNLLPIPILDGGHLVFLGIEAVRGQALSLEQRMRWSHVGFIVIVGIMLWALSNDFLRLLGL